MRIHAREDRPGLIGTVLVLSAWVPFAGLSILIMLR
jgi:hypothetical protein